MQKYLDNLEFIQKKGTIRKNRSGIDTIGVFGMMTEYDISKTFPLLTTKKMFWKGIVHELLWMLSGDTNIKYLNEQGIHIWDKNAESFFENKIEPLQQERPTTADSIRWFDDIERGDLGPVYGFQWRKFGENYTKNTKTREHRSSYHTDQIKKVINQIKNNPESRRIILSAWNPRQIEQVALPPCHVMSQFYVDNGTLSCMMTQRSADMFLGVPFNIASYSLLTYILANICSLKPGKFVHSIGDAHIYTNHINQVKEQISRKPFSLPKLRINKKIEDIDNISFEDFSLIDYQCYPTIKAEMAV